VKLLATSILSVLLLPHPTTAAGPQCLQILQQALADKNPDTRKLAVAALSLAGPRAVPLVITMLQDKDVDVRVAAVSTLAETRSGSVVAGLRKALDDEVPEVGFAAAKALWSMNDATGKRVLLAVLQGESNASSSFLSKQKRDALRMMQTPRTAFFFALRSGAGLVPVPGLGFGVSSMQTLMTDPGTSSRAASALLLATDPDPATVTALTEALQDKDGSVRAAAVHALALRRDGTLKNRLDPLLADENKGVQLRAAAVCVRLSPRASS
jgi:HEAT repeat protein